VFAKHVVTSEAERLAMYGKFPKSVLGSGAFGVEGTDPLAQPCPHALIAHAQFELGNLQL
jgi:hypothetical protein